MIIPDEVLIVGGILLVIELIIKNGLNVWVNILNGLIAFIIMYLIKKFGDFLFKKESMGGGDIKLMSLFGLVLGWQLSIISIFIASFIGLPSEMKLFPFCEEWSLHAVDRSFGILQRIQSSDAVIQHLFSYIYSVIKRHLSGDILRRIVLGVFIAPPVRKPVAKRLS